VQERICNSKTYYYSIFCSFTCHYWWGLSL